MVHWNESYTKNGKVLHIILRDAPLCGAKDTQYVYYNTPKEIKDRHFCRKCFKSLQDYT
jgi:hypothetical protein